MNQIVLDYYKRFAAKESIKFDKFFTQLEISEYISKLPFLYEIDSFCISLFKALVLNERICIYSDYDTDAVTATATAYWGLVELGFKKENLSFYAPDRFTEGYGMNVEAVKELAKKNNLIISVDCGINSTSEAKAILNTNCDLIITDHHHLNGEIPDCVAVINPQVANYYLQTKAEYKDSSKLLEDWDNKEFSGEIKRWNLELKKLRFSQELENNLLSTSVTGVGVTWFSLVWFGYFLEDIGYKKT